MIKNNVSGLAATVDDRMLEMRLPGQFAAFAQRGRPGVSHLRLRSQGRKVDCLHWRDQTGTLRGLLYHYRSDFPPFDQRGDVTLWVDPEYRGRGVGVALVEAADRRWNLDFRQQRYTVAGLALVRAYLADRAGTLAR